MNRIKEKHNELKRVIGYKAYNALLKHKATLRIWRNSTPHNWWVQGKRGKYYWHSERGKSLPPLSLFELIENSSDVVTYYGKSKGSDDGLPMESVYKLRSKE